MAICCLVLIQFRLWLHFITVQIAFVSVYVGGRPIWKELHIRLSVSSFCIISICVLDISHFGFEDRILILIVPVPGHC